jgi:hypothetical protein
LFRGDLETGATETERFQLPTQEELDAEKESGAMMDLNLLRERINSVVGVLNNFKALREEVRRPYFTHELTGKRLVFFGGGGWGVPGAEPFSVNVE